MKKHNQFPKGWNEARVQAVLEHYEAQTEEEAVAEDEAAYEDHSYRDGGPSRTGPHRT